MLKKFAAVFYHVLSNKLVNSLPHQVALSPSRLDRQNAKGLPLCFSQIDLCPLHRSLQERMSTMYETRPQSSRVMTSLACWRRQAKLRQQTQAVNGCPMAGNFAAGDPKHINDRN